MQPHPALVALTTCLLLGAGCLGATPPTEDEAPAEPAPPPAPSSEWGTFTLRATGAAGDWLLAFQPLPPNATNVNHAVSVEITIEDAGPALVLEPDVLMEFGQSMNFLDDGPRLLDTGGTLSSSETITTGYHESMRGFVVGIGAVTGWSIDVTIELEAGGPVAQNTVLLRGNGTTSARAAATAGTNAPAGQVSLALPTDTPGWTHLSLVTETVQPSGVRAVDASFASGHTFSRQGAAARLTTPVSSGGPSTGYFTDIGTRANAAGDNTIEARFADVASAGRAVGIHLPGADTWTPGSTAAVTYALG